MGIILKDWYGKDQTFDHDRIWVRDTDGGLVPFTKGTGEVTLESLEVTENGIFTPPDGVDGFNQVTVNVEDEVNELLFNKTDFAGFAADDSLEGLYTKTLSFGTDIDALEIVLGREYTVSWDGALYTSAAKDTYRVFEEEDPIDGTTLYRYKYYLGNGSLLGYSDIEDTGESFVIVYKTYSNELVLISTEDLDSHNVAIMKRVRPQDGLDMMLQSITVTENGTYTADPVYDGLKQVVVEVAGTSSADVRYVTFMSYDGLTEYGKKAVAVGDDCADPIARGIFDTPTRESDAQYNYTHNGWATEANGAVDSNALKAVTEDKTVYASFASAVRYYTITYYDGDGSTVLKTESKAYGSTLSYAPTKDGYVFTGWNPSLSTVTGDANYIAQWEESDEFANASWEKIAEKSADGTASQAWAVGDTKTVTLTYSDGTSEDITVAIAGFNHDELADGTGKAGISLICMTVPSKTVKFGRGEGVYYYHPNYTNQCSNAYKLLEDTIKPALPSELIEVIKPVAKLNRYKKSGTIYTESANFNLWALSLDELGCVLDETTGYTNTDYTSLGTKYDLFSKLSALASISSQNKVKITTGSTYANYWTRHMKNDLATACCVTNNGVITTKTAINFSSLSYYVRFGFCI